MDDTRSGNSSTQATWSWSKTSDSFNRPPLQTFSVDELRKFFEQLLHGSEIDCYGVRTPIELDRAVGDLREVAHDLFVGRKTNYDKLSLSERQEYMVTSSQVMNALALISLRGSQAISGSLLTGNFAMLDSDFLRITEGDFVFRPAATGLSHFMFQRQDAMWELISEFGESAAEKYPMQIEFDALPDEVKKLVLLAYFENKLAPIAKDFVDRGLITGLSPNVRAYFSSHTFIDAQNAIKGLSPAAAGVAPVFRELRLART